MKQSKYSLLNTADEKLGWAAERMMGMQEDADRWPVRVMANLTQYMLSISNGDPEQFSWGNENRDRRVLSEWLTQYRDKDPDPTEP